MKPRKFKNLVQMIAYSKEGTQIMEALVPMEAYFEKEHPLLDQMDFRKARQISRLYGRIYDAAGAIAQEFQVRFDDAGRCLREAVRLEDGTTLGDWENLPA